MILPKFKPGDLVSASDWNLIASEVNRIWGSEGANGIRLTKGEPWRIQKTGRTTPPTAVCQAGGLNGPAYKVYVWRNDRWDFGSAEPPLAFFVGGAFTAWGDQPAVRIAKFVETTDCELSTIGVDPEWQALNEFGVAISHLGTSKGSTPYLLAGSLSGGQRNGVGGFNVAWLINWDTGELHPSWSPMSGSVIGPGFFGSVLNLCATDEYVFANRFTNIVRSKITDSTNLITGTGVNIHNAVADSTNIFISSRKQLDDGFGSPVDNIYGAEPRSLAYIDADYAVDTTFGALAGVGGGTDCFTLTLSLKEAWENEFDEDKICWGVHSLEFTGTEYSWAGGVYEIGSPTSAIVPITKAGFVHPMVFAGSGMVFTGGGRAQIFCYHDAIWFGGGMTSVSAFGVGPIATTANNSLVRYEINSNTTDVFEFNGTVRDCQHFHDGQMIVVGDFTEYNGQPAPYMAFLDQGGNLLSSLTWP